MRSIRLAAAQQLARAQQERAESQARSARQRRRRAVYLLGALVVAVRAALAAVVFGQCAAQSAAQANQNLSVAQAAQATAQGEADARATQQAVAEANLTRYDKTVRLWNVATGQEIRQFVGHSDVVWIAVFSPDGKLLATASHDGTVRVWDVASGQEMRRYAADALGVENVTWSPDGRLLVSVGDDGTAKLWDVDYQTTIAYLCGHLQRDLTDAERAQYNITDANPTCGT